MSTTLLDQQVPALALENYYNTIYTTDLNTSKPLIERQMYYALGIANEWQEFSGIVSDWDDCSDNQVKELGDVFWYVTSLLATVQPIVDFSITVGEATALTPPDEGLLANCVYSDIGDIIGNVKKLWRDGPSDSRNEQLQEQLNALLVLLVQACILMDVDPNAVLAKNVEKLLDRKYRNVIAGDGDNR